MNKSAPFGKNKTVANAGEVDERYKLVYMIFDILFLKESGSKAVEVDCMQSPLVERRKIIQKVV